MCSENICREGKRLSSSDLLNAFERKNKSDKAIPNQNRNNSNLFFGTFLLRSISLSLYSTKNSYVVVFLNQFLKTDEKHHKKNRIRNTIGKEIFKRKIIDSSEFINVTLKVLNIFLC